MRHPTTYTRTFECDFCHEVKTKQSHSNNLFKLRYCSSKCSSKANAIRKHQGDEALQGEIAKNLKRQRQLALCLNS